MDEVIQLLLRGHALGKQTFKVIRWILIGGLLCLLAMLGIFWGSFYRVRSFLTETEEADIPVVKVSEKERRALLPKYRIIEDSIRESRTAEIELSSQDIDKMIATVDRLKRLRGRLSVQLEAGMAWVTVSIPLDVIPLFKNRYLNGRFKVEVCVDGQGLKVRVVEGRNSVGEAYPRWLIDQLNELVKKPEQFDHLAPGVRRHVETLRIEGERMYIRVRGKK